MSFKEAYIKWLENKLTDLLPSGYSIKIIEEIGISPGNESKSGKKTEIKCYVKFGSASKQNNTNDRINQPIIFNIISEADGFEIARDTFDLFFQSYSKTNMTLKIDEDDYNLWHFYNSPVLNSSFESMGLYQRVRIIMTGIVSYSKDKILGVKWYLDNEEIQIVNPQIQYTTEVETPNHYGENTGSSILLGANNSFAFTMLLDKSTLASKLRDVAIQGNTYSGILKIEYLDKTYEINVKATNVSLINDSNTGDNVITCTLMRE